LLNATPATGGANPTQRQTYPQGPPQQTLPSTNQRRAIERAQAQNYEGDYATGLPLDVFGMQRISPDQLSSVLSTQSSGRSPISPASQLDLTSVSGATNNIGAMSGGMPGPAGAYGAGGPYGAGFSNGLTQGYGPSLDQYPYVAGLQTQRRLALPPIARR